MSRAPDPKFNTKLPEDSDKYGALQRLMLDVPNPATTLLLGQRYTPDPPFGYSGSSLVTVKNFYADITEKTLFQGHQAVVFQTDQTFQHYSTGSTTVYAKGLYDLTSGVQTVLSSVPFGNETTGADMKTADDYADEVPAVKTYIAIRDKLLNDEIKTKSDTIPTLAGALKTLKADAGWPYSGDDEVEVAGTLISAAATDLKSGGAGTDAGLGVVSDKPIAILSNTTVLAFGRTGIHLVGGNNDEPHDFGAYGSRNASIRAGVRAEIMGKTNVSVVGGTADVAGKTDAALCARTATAAVLGKTVKIGAKSGAGALGPFSGIDSGTQKDTDDVIVEAKKSITVDSDDKVTVLGKTISVQGTTKIEFKLGSFKMEFTSSAVKLTGGAASIEFKPSAIEMKVGGGSVKIEAAKVTVAAGGGKVEVGPAGVTVNGMPISVG